MAEKDKSGIIYVLTNPAMPDLVKIGHTKRKDVKDRLEELYTSGVPMPFKCEYAGEVQDVNKVEKALHNAFKKNRLNNKREFFSIDLDQVTGILEIISASDPVDVTQEVQNKADAVDPKAQKRFEKLVRPSLSFAQMGIPDGAEFRFKGAQETSAYATEVHLRTSRKVIKSDGSAVSFRKLTQELKEIENVDPFGEWTYKGISLRDIYKKCYDKESHGEK